MKSEHDPWYVNFASVAILIMVVVCAFLIVASVISQSKAWLVPAVLMGIGIALTAFFRRIRRNILESLRPRLKYERKKLNYGFKVALLVLLPALIGAIVFVLNYMQEK
jgi:hypothetical protein